MTFATRDHCVTETGVCRTWVVCRWAAFCRTHFPPYVLGWWFYAELAALARMLGGWKESEEE